MTPEQRHADAVIAAREWRNDQRERMQLPTRGDFFTVRWPGGPYDFWMKFIAEDTSMPSPPADWFYLHCQVLEPESWHNASWTVMAHLVGDEWTMLPKGGRLSDVG